MAFFAPQKSTVAQVMADFQNRINELNELAVEQDKEAARLAQSIEDAQAAMKAATDEAAYARELAARLQEVYLPSQAISVNELRTKCCEHDHHGSNYA